MAYRVLGPWPGIELQPTTVKSMNLKHWITREFLLWLFFIVLFQSEESCIFNILFINYWLVIALPPFSLSCNSETPSRPILDLAFIICLFFHLSHLFVPHSSGILMLCFLCTTLVLSCVSHYSAIPLNLIWVLLMVMVVN